MRYRLLVVLAAGLLAGPLVANSMMINGDFETGDLSGWIATDGVSSQSFGAQISGNYSALLDAGGGGLDLSELDTFFGLSAGTLAAASLCNPSTCINGQGMYQSITVSAGETISFDWYSFLEGGEYNDSAFLIPGNGDVVLLANGSDGLDGIVAGFSYTFGSAGTYNFGFGIVNGLDECCGSSLFIDNVGPRSLPVPAPATLVLLGLGLAGLGWSRRKTEPLG